MITLALIGVGHWGINFLKTIKKMEGCEIKYIAAKTNTSLSRFSSKFIKTTNYRDFLKYNDIDGIIIATPGSTHFKIIKDFISVGLPVLVEKPLAISYRDALSLKTSLKNKTSNIMVGHTYLYNPAYLKIKKMISKIGAIRYISFKLLNYGVFIDDMSSLWQFAPHGVSICLDILNQLPEEISAWEIKILRPGTKLADNFCLKLKFKNGVNCLLECGWLYPIKRRELIIYGAKSTIVFDDLADKKIIFYKNLGPNMIDGKVLEGKVKIEYPDYEQTSALELEIKEFIKLIQGQKKTYLDRAIEVVKVVDVAQKSLNSNGNSIRLDKLYQ